MNSECSTKRTANIDWSDAIGAEKQQPYFQSALAYVKQQRNSGKTVYPSPADVFNAFKLTPLDQVKVVIIGQDPYHGPDQAHGLCFSVKRHIRIPPSLQNIYKELESDMNIAAPSHGDLSSWARQGVLLLNTVLTVEAGNAHSHRSIGWETFTDKVISEVSKQKQHVVFILWGSHAQKKTDLIDIKKHTILKAPHPSPLSAHRGFFGSKPFSLCNIALEQHDQASIAWHELD